VYTERKYATELEDTNMKKATAQKAKTYRLPETTTPEMLEMRLMNDRGSILTFGDHILAAGYFYDPNGRCYYGATYRFTTEDHTCEGEIKLVSISGETFLDNGHAIAWAMQQ
jgi:hypothetical protein